MDTARPSQGPLLPITCAFVASARVCRLPACHSTHSFTWSAFTTATSLPLQVELVGSPGTIYITLLLSSTQLWQIQGVVPLLGATHIMQLQAEPAATAAAIIIASLIVGTTIPCCTIASLPLLPPSHMQEDPPETYLSQIFGRGYFACTCAVHWQWFRLPLHGWAQNGISMIGPTIVLLVTFIFSVVSWIISVQFNISDSSLM